MPAANPRSPLPCPDLRRQLVSAALIGRFSGPTRNSFRQLEINLFDRPMTWWISTSSWLIAR
jgi:hypothetical protein